MYYALVFYIRWALRPAVLVRLSVNLTKGERNSALRADDIRPYGGIVCRRSAYTTAEPHGFLRRGRRLGVPIR